MTKLLTDGELEDAVSNIVTIEDCQERHDSIVALIQSQKRAYGEMVIGEDDDMSAGNHIPKWRNQLRKIQRERNK